MSRRRPTAGGGLALALAVGACHAGSSPKVPGGVQQERAVDGGGSMRLAGDELDQLEHDLYQAQQQLEALDAGAGAMEERATEAEAGPAPAAPSRCERIQTLADRICGLRDRMCTLATEHDQQPRYAQACSQAEQTCTQAQQAAEGCEG